MMGTMFVGQQFLQNVLGYCDEQHVGDAAEHVDLREDRDLDDRRDEQQRRGLEAVGERHGAFDAFIGIRAATASIPVSFENGATCTVR